MTSWMAWPTDDHASLGELIEDTHTGGLEDAAVRSSMRALVADMLDALTPREAAVLRMRYGIETPGDHTLEEVGQRFDLSRESIRKIEASAMKKLRGPGHAGKLRSFLETS